MKDLVPLAKLATQLPAVRGDKPPNRATLYRWATVGLKSRSGKRIRLETAFIGGTLCSTVDAVERFCDRKNDVQLIERQAPLTKWQLAELEKRSKAAFERVQADGFIQVAT